MDQSQANDIHDNDTATCRWATKKLQYDVHGQCDIDPALFWRGRQPFNQLSN